MLCCHNGVQAIASFTVHVQWLAGSYVTVQGVDRAPATLTLSNTLISDETTAFEDAVDALLAVGTTSPVSSRAFGMTRGTHLFSVKMKFEISETKFRKHSGILSFTTAVRSLVDSNGDAFTADDSEGAGCGSATFEYVGEGGCTDPDGMWPKYYQKTFVYATKDTDEGAEDCTDCTETSKVASEAKRSWCEEQCRALDHCVAYSHQAYDGKLAVCDLYGNQLDDALELDRLRSWSSVQTNIKSSNAIRVRRAPLYFNLYCPRFHHRRGLVTATYVLLAHKSVNKLRMVQYLTFKSNHGFRRACLLSRGMRASGRCWAVVAC